MIIIVVGGYLSTLLWAPLDRAPSRSFREILLVGFLQFSLLFVISTEVFSHAQSLTWEAVSIFWCLVIAMSTAVRYRKIAPLTQRFRAAVDKGRGVYASFNRAQRGLLLLTGGVLLGVLLQALLYPPNNWDSLTYHMGRVSHWIENASVEHYSTYVYRQLYQPPFAEFVIVHTILLSGSDLWANSVQWVYLLFSVLTVSLILNRLNYGRTVQLFAVVFCLLTPEILLQGSSTQNDIILSFFLLSALYWTIKSWKEGKTYASIALFAVSIGLGLLTKGTGYVYAAPLLVLFALAYLRTIIQEKAVHLLLHGVVAGVIVLAIQGAHYKRNYDLTGDPLGMLESRKYQYRNEQFTLQGTTSNIVRNMSNHGGVYPISEVILWGVQQAHAVVGWDPSDTRYTYANQPFKVPRRLSHEDSASNPLQLLLFWGAVALLGLHAYRRKSYQYVSKPMLGLTALIFLQFLLFCFYLKWQPWHTRLHTPLFFEFSLVVAPVMALSWNKRLNYAALYLCLVYAGLILLLNNLRPFVTIPPITQDIRFWDSRERKYFANKLETFDDFEPINQQLQAVSYDKVALHLKGGGDFWEYLLSNDFQERPSDQLVPLVLPVEEMEPYLWTPTASEIEPVIYVIAASADRVQIGDKTFYPVTEGKELSLFKIRD